MATETLYEIARELGYHQIDVDNALSRVAEEREERGGFADEDEHCKFALLDLVSRDENLGNWITLVAAMLRDAERGK